MTNIYIYIKNNAIWKIHVKLERNDNKKKSVNSYLEKKKTKASGGLRTILDKIRNRMGRSQKWALKKKKRKEKSHLIL